MKGIVVAVAAGVLLAGAPAVAEVSGQEDRFMKDPAEKTVYATNEHMRFSVRSSIIHWLGGVTVIKEHDLRSAERDRWWGQSVPLIPTESVQQPATR